jgi:tRNA A37 threonylcarbamoyladenosine modification protein TsaB
MIILAIRTDKPEGELYLYKDAKKPAEIKWQAHRQLAETIHEQINKILNPDKKLLDKSSNFNGVGKSRYTLSDIEGIVVFKGPGSFTGLRISHSVANALAYAQNIPIVARSGGKWLEQGIKDLQGGQNEKIVTPEYGVSPKTTSPKK